MDFWFDMISKRSAPNVVTYTIVIDVVTYTISLSYMPLFFSNLISNASYRAMSGPGEDVNMTARDEVPLVDMMTGEELQANAQQTQRRKRGPTMCASTSEKKQLEIQFTKDGRAKGPNRAHYSNWVNNLVKQKADIRIESWDKIKDETKAEWWEIIKVKVLADRDFLF